MGKAKDGRREAIERRRGEGGFVCEKNRKKRKKRKKTVSSRE